MGIKILRRGETLPVKIDDVVFYIAGLTFQQKTEIEAMKTSKGKTLTTRDLSPAIKLAIRYSIKKLEGIENLDGSAYELQFEDETKSILTDDCAEELLNCAGSDKLLLSVMQLLNGIPKEFVNPFDGKPLHGVEILNIKK